MTPFVKSCMRECLCLMWTMLFAAPMALLVLFAESRPAAALQPRATIRIEVKADQQPVAGARVTVNGMPFHSGRDGSVLTSCPLGPVEITVRKEGFLPGATSLVADEPREFVLILELQVQAKVEEAITVYATRTDQRLQDLPTRVEVLGEEEIEEKTMMTPGDIVMLLNETGGLRVQTTSPSLGAASVRIQGMRGRYTLFLEDGLPLFGQQGGGLGLLQIPPMDLAQVEVIKGASSALYGAGAMAGVVNLISRRPTSDLVYDFLFNRSTLGATDGAIFLAAPLSPHWGASVLAGGHFQEARDRDGDRWADLAAYQRGLVRPRFFWDGGNGRTGFLTGGVTYENRSGGSMPGASLQQTGAPYAEALDTRRYDLGGSLQFLIHNRVVATARLAASSQRHNHLFGEFRERDRHDTLFGELAFRGAAGRNTWVAGLAAEREAYRPRDLPHFSYTHTAPGLFFQDDFALRPWLSISASARADFHNRFGAFLSPRLAALLRWAGWTSRLSVGQGFFAPTPLTEETEAAGLTRLLIPRPLLAERGRSASFDLSRRLRAFSTTATLFASRVRNPVHVERTTQYQLVNLASPVENAGLELLGTLRMARFSATASYAYVRSREVVDSGSSDVPLTPRHSFGAVGMWEKEGVARIGLECYFTGQQRLEQNPYRSRSEPYVILGLLAERKFGPFSLFLNAENLTGVRQTRWNPLLRPTRAVDGRWTVDAWSPLEGRVFNGGIRLRF